MHRVINQSLLEERQALYPQDMVAAIADRFIPINKSDDHQHTVSLVSDTLITLEKVGDIIFRHQQGRPMISVSLTMDQAKIWVAMDIMDEYKELERNFKRATAAMQAYLE